ncbi:MAG: rhodanese-like domain-containing protein [Bacteroidia bacterium]
MKVEQIYTGCLAQGAYYIESEGEAIIIDPLRETQHYIDKLTKEGAKLKYIFETHFHADFVSGHLDLANKTGATIIYGPTAETEFDITNASDGEIIKLGNVQFKVLHTPGHTIESTTYLLQDEQGKDHAIFTGDTLFLGDVGRPDLAIKQGDITKEDLAGMLFDSLRSKIMPLADEVIVYPAHGAGSACGKNLSTETWGYLGEQKKNNYALRADMSRAEFVEEVTSGLMPPPQYFPKNAMLNKTGYQSMETILDQGLRSLSPAQFEQIAEAKEALILDTRTQSEFRQGFIPNSIFIGINGSFAPWVGTLIPDIKQTILIVAPEGKEEEVITRLSRVGYDHTLGYLKGGIKAWQQADKEIDRIESIAATDLSAELAQSANGVIVDVRKPTEYVSQHAEAALNIPLDFVNSNMARFGKEDHYYVHCKSGYRSMIMASILKARGIHNLTDIDGGFLAMEKAGLSMSNYVCPTKVSQEVLDNAIAEVI